MDIAEKKLSENDYVGAKKFLTKVQNLYPHLDGLSQVSMMIHVYITAANKIINGGKESDLYGVIGVDPLADDEALKKQYKKLALLLHPDKNKFRGAEDEEVENRDAEATCTKPTQQASRFFQMVKLEVSRRDQRMHPSQLLLVPIDIVWIQMVKLEVNSLQVGHRSHLIHTSQLLLVPIKVLETVCIQVLTLEVISLLLVLCAPVNSSNLKKHSMFWTMCNGCDTGSECWRDLYLNKTIYCQSCGHAYIATEQNPWDRYVTYLHVALSLLQQQWISAHQNQATNKNTNGASSSSSSSFDLYMNQLNYTVSLLKQQQARWSAKNQAANNNNNTSRASPPGTSSSSPYIGATPQEKFALQQLYLSFSHLLKLQQQWTPQTTSSGGTYYPSSYSGGNTANQAQERCKRGREEEDSQETIAAIEMAFKKLRKDHVL
ncbi:unnamed protein product [Brassica oleracea var. botrytis]